MLYPRPCREDDVLTLVPLTTADPGDLDEVEIDVETTAISDYTVNAFTSEPVTGVIGKDFSSVQICIKKV